MSKSLPENAVVISPDQLTPSEIAVPTSWNRLSTTCTGEFGAVSSRLRPDRVFSMVLWLIVRSAPLPSDQIPRPHEAVPYLPVADPVIRLSSIVTLPEVAPVPT